MKCNKCGSKWETDASYSSSLTVCPFCREKLVTGKTGDWQFFDNTKDLLAFVVAEYGVDALFGRKYFSDHSTPLMPKDQKNLVKQAFECGAVKILQDNMNSDQARKETAVKQAVGKMVHTYASAKEAAERVVWEFTNAVGWSMPEPQSQRSPQNTTVVQGQPPNTSAPIPQPHPVTDTGKLLTRAWLFAEDGDWKESVDYFNKVLDADPYYAPAYLGLLCVDLKISNENKLANVADPGSIANHKYYKRAVADSAIKARLDGYIQTIKARIDAEQKAAAAEAERKRIAAEEAARKKRVQDAFDNACMIMNSAQNPDDYRKAITAFGNIIDSNYLDINNQIKNKIAECQKKIAVIEANFKKKYGILLDRFSKEGKAQAGQKRQAAQAEVEAKCEQIKKKFEGDHKAWKEEYSRIKAAYDTEYRKWENAVNAVKAQAESRKSQGLCPHCGGTIKGMLFAKKCTECGKSPGDPVKTPSAPAQPNYPIEPVLPQMPTYTPRRLEADIDIVAVIKGEFVFVRFGDIDWRVLEVENNKALLISEKVLEERPYNVKKEAITWETCDLRKYLNTDFYNRLGAVKSAIAETRNSNPNNSWYGTSGGNATTDKVFLLSLDEVVKYFGDSGDLRNKRRKDYEGNIKSDGFCLYDEYNAARIAKNGKGEACWWWLRSPGFISSIAAYVSPVGPVYVDGLIVSIDSGGVRPAFWLNLES